MPPLVLYVESSLICSYLALVIGLRDQKGMLKHLTNELYMMRIVESEGFLYHIFFGLSLEQKVIDLKPLSWSGKEKEASSG